MLGEPGAFYLGSDLPAADWSAAVDLALRSFGQSPFVLQRYYRPAVVPSQWYDFDRTELIDFQAACGCARSIL